MTKTLFIEGMSCGHCVAHVEEALKEMCGVTSAKVSLQDKSAVVELAHDVEDNKFKEAIEEAGYELIRIQ
jgi:copper ion binding protein